MGVCSSVVEKVKANESSIKKMAGAQMAKQGQNLQGDETEPHPQTKSQLDMVKEAVANKQVTPELYQQVVVPLATQLGANKNPTAQKLLAQFAPTAEAAKAQIVETGHDPEALEKGAPATVEGKGEKAFVSKEEGGIAGDMEKEKGDDLGDQKFEQQQGFGQQQQEVQRIVPQQQMPQQTKQYGQYEAPADFNENDLSNAMPTDPNANADQGYVN